MHRARQIEDSVKLYYISQKGGVNPWAVWVVGGVHLALIIIGTVLEYYYG